ncbi:dihydrofolate reductase [Streptomyces sp. SCUT-3]|uniref:2-hydroxyacid dehydrogenase n=1 Tax=Streptomyces sp. SCUT-3 TaxID=2684469 RepID=UPI000CC56462|nr:2-hydroxyacid dehydrogenase [Streptomyces sp. SCUT-3]PLW71272.1 dihydrofolate reductase [Streptomyces sp. DJ]QMV21640.1 dihydrofolate reductase [Streptomyces sp. SCUT-3]
MADNAAPGTGHEPAEVWLSLPPEEIEDLPAGPRYLFWDGGEEYPGDPGRVRFYVPPYMKGDAGLRPLPLMGGLRVLQTLTAGVEDVLPHVPPGVVLCNARGVHEASTAELAVTLVLASLRGVPRFVRGQDAEQWHAGFYPALADRTVLVVGHGAIGSAIEDRLTPFGCDVLRVARSARSTPRGPVHALADLPGLLPRADVVILSVPLTGATAGLADAGFLARMKDGALLVNVARGRVVDTGALLAELESGRLHAALDVTDPEPLPPGHPLWHAPNVLITPHVGGSSSAFRPRAHRLLRSQLFRFVAGEDLRNVVAVT